MAWQSPVQGSSAMMILHNQLNNMAQALRTWSKSLFIDAKLQPHTINEVIMRLEVARTGVQNTDRNRNTTSKGTKASGPGLGCDRWMTSATKFKNNPN